MQDTQTTLQDIKNKIKEFIEERDWRQYHNPKNSTMNLIGEAAELMEHFTWSTTEESWQVARDKKEEVEHEIADVIYTIFDICTILDIDIATIFEKKMVLNAQKYPVEKAKSKNLKYTEL